MGFCCCFGDDEKEEKVKQPKKKNEKRKSRKSKSTEQTALLSKEGSSQTTSSSNGKKKIHQAPSPLQRKEEEEEKVPEYGLGESIDSNSQLWDAVAQKHDKRVSVICDMSRTDSTLYESEPKKIPLRYSHASYNVPSSPPTYKRRDSTIWEDMRQNKKGGNSPVDTKRRESKRTYSNLGSDEENEVTFQSPYIAFPPPDDVTTGDTDDQEYKSLLHFLKKEFIEVEESYVQALHMVTKEYLQPMLTHETLADPVVKEILGALYNIKACNVIFLEEMKDAVAKHGSTEDPLPYAAVSIGDACVNHMRTFRTLATYAALYESFLKYVSGLKEEAREEYSDFISTIQKKMEEESPTSTRDLSINSLLMRPIQMLAKYRVILQRLVDSTKSDDPEFESLEQAVEEATGVCNYCNQRWKEHDGKQMVPEIEARWGLKGLAKPGRHCIMDGEMEKITRKSKTPMKCVVYLFNDLLVCITFKKGISEADKDKKCFSLPLLDTKEIKPDVPQGLLDACGMKGPVQNTLSVVAKEYTLALILPTDSLKNLWYETMTDVRAALVKRLAVQRHRSILGIDLHDD